MRTLPPSSVVRLGRLLWPGGNPLARGEDRLESASVLLSVLLALALVPVMLTLGSLTYENLAEERAQQVATRYETVAVLTADAPATAYGDYGAVASGTSIVQARWRLPDGSVRAGLVQANSGLNAGDEVPLWLDERGTPVGPPMSVADVAMSAMLVGALGWAAIAGVLALACWGLHRALNRRRYRAWEAEWAEVEPDWHDRRR